MVLRKGNDVTSSALPHNDLRATQREQTLQCAGVAAKQLSSCPRFVGKQDCNENAMSPLQASVKRCSSIRKQDPR